MEFLRQEATRLEVDVRLNTGLSAQLLDDLKPDVVILATGSLPEMPIIKGLFQTKMILATVVEILDGTAKSGKKIIVLGGGQSGLVLADWLAEQGKEVAVLNRKRHFGDEMSSNDRFYLRERLKRDSVRLYKKVAVDKFTADGAVFRSDGKPVELTGFDTVVLSENMESVRDAMTLLRERNIEVHMIGDAKTPRNLMLAQSEADEIARSI